MEHAHTPPAVDITHAHTKFVKRQSVDDAPTSYSTSFHWWISLTFFCFVCFCCVDVVSCLKKGISVALINVVRCLNTLRVSYLDSLPLFTYRPTTVITYPKTVSWHQSNFAVWLWLHIIYLVGKTDSNWRGTIRQSHKHSSQPPTGQTRHLPTEAD